MIRKKIVSIGGSSIGDKKIEAEKNYGEKGEAGNGFSRRHVDMSEIKVGKRNMKERCIGKWEVTNKTSVQNCVDKAAKSKKAKVKI